MALQYVDKDRLHLNETTIYDKYKKLMKDEKINVTIMELKKSLYYRP